MTASGTPGSGDVRTPPVSRSKRAFVKSFGDGRTCAEPTCKTTLSRYNNDHLCWRHAEVRDAGPYRRP